MAPTGERLLQCVPNVSEGRDRAIISSFAQAVASAGARLLDVHADTDHNRSVFTFIGSRPAVEAGALALARMTVEHLDLRTHRGVHPRIGVIDLIPFVPLRGSVMADAVVAAHRVGSTLGAELGIPVFYYGEAALVPERRRLPVVRRGEFEGLAARMATPEGRPDVGPASPHPRAGATAVGARDVLVAFNAVLDSNDLPAAQGIARTIRESSGGLPAVRALGVRLQSRARVQVTMNLLDYRRTSVADVIGAIERAASRGGLSVREYELVGCAPADAFHAVDRSRVRMSESQLLDQALLCEPQPAARRAGK